MEKNEQLHFWSSGPTKSKDLKNLPEITCPYCGYSPYTWTSSVLIEDGNKATWMCNECHEVFLVEIHIKHTFTCSSLI